MTTLPTSNDRPIWPAVKRGLQCKCPNCGTTPLFNTYLKVNDVCAHCGTELHHQRADDAPPYFTMMVTGHVIVGLLLMVEKRFQPDVWVHLALWLPTTVLLSLWLLPRIKGALIAHQWALRMHGFGVPVAGADYPERWAGDDRHGQNAGPRA